MMKLLIVATMIASTVAVFLPPKPSPTECSCQGQTKIKAKTGRGLSGNADLDNRLMECDNDFEKCGKCCANDPTARDQGCKVNQGLEGCKTTCEATLQSCEEEAENWASLMQLNCC